MESKRYNANSALERPLNGSFHTLYIYMTYITYISSILFPTVVADRSRFSENE